MKQIYYKNLYNEIYKIMDRIQSADDIREAIANEIPNALFKVDNATMDFEKRPFQISFALLVIKHTNLQIWLDDNKGFKCQFSEKNNYAITNFNLALRAAYEKPVNLRKCRYI